MHGYELLISIFNCCQFKLIGHTYNVQRWLGCQIDVARHKPPQLSPTKGLVILEQWHLRTRTYTEIVSQSSHFMTTLIENMILICKVLFCIAVHEQLIKKGNTPKIIA